MYKKASRLKLRFQSSKGILATEQLWTLNQSDLKALVKALYDEKQKFTTTTEELAFLEGPVGSDKEADLAVLRYEIVKDIYLTKQGESKEAINKLEKKKEIARLEEILARKEEAELESLSAEELKKKIAELSK